MNSLLELQMNYKPILEFPEQIIYTLEYTYTVFTVIKQSLKYQGDAENENIRNLFSE